MIIDKSQYDNSSVTPIDCLVFLIFKYMNGKKLWRLL
jgi:hypothetical protein